MKWRRMFRFRILTLLVAVAVFGGLLVANTRRHSPRLFGHVVIHEGPLMPGMFVIGHDYGWPWVYKSESFKTKHFSITYFDTFSWPWLAGNAAIGTCLVVAAMALCESGLWLFRSPRHRH
jgi:hypothetical protein